MRFGPAVEQRSPSRRAPAEEVLPRRALIINFAGLGNGINLLPLLQRLEAVAPHVEYFHCENAALEIAAFREWLGLRRLLGTVPALWRRFLPRDWAGIREFLMRHEIELVINLRNSAGEQDAGYQGFKREAAPRGLRYWEIDVATGGRFGEPVRSLDQHLSVFRARGVELEPVNRAWIREGLAARGALRAGTGEVGLFTGVSQEVKRWPTERWIRLGELLLSRTPRPLVVYAGQEPAERAVAEEIHARLRRRFGERCAYVAGLSIEALCAHLSGLDLLIACDTACVHLAAALALPCVGLYLATDARIWGGVGDEFIPIQSQRGLHCEDQKPGMGSCRFYYGGCPGPCRDEVTPARVFSVAAARLARGASQAEGRHP